jgi:cytochrome c oxidase cbb3-type subunit 3
MSDHLDPTTLEKNAEGVPIIPGPDGLRELDNPMPHWMTLVYVGTVIWGIGYLVFYPGAGLNMFSWGQYKSYDAEIAEAKARFPQAGGDLASVLTAAVKDPAQISAGKAAFAANCAACHGAEAKGAIGPNLTDASWLYGGKPEAIAHTIQEGTAKGMPSFKSQFSAQQVAQLAAFVHSLSK